MTARDTVAARSSEWVDRARLESTERLTADVSAAYLEAAGLLPQRLEGDEVILVSWLSDPDPEAISDLELVFGRRARLVAGDERDVRAAIREIYGSEAFTAEGLLSRIAADAEPPQENVRGPALDDVLSGVGEAPVVRLVNFLLVEALEAAASDVHIESYESGMRVRYRIDGVLQDAPTIPTHMIPSVVSRLKVMADLDIAERRVPQDGRVRLPLADRTVDVRVSTLPTLHGESVVLRLLDKSRVLVSLDGLGMPPHILAGVRSVLARPNGIVLATGPTGSGKTTTLYAAVSHLRTGREKILTVEDPVEYELLGVPQVPVREKVGVTFAGALRSILRQGPDIILVGEIRDPDTAEIATHAALTGHLVLSTLHTNDAPSAITRLLDLGLAPYLVSSTLEAVLAQRLVRLLCADCKTTGPPDASVRRLGPGWSRLRDVAYAAGCDRCRGTGYRGRTGLFELLILDDDLRDRVRRRPSTSEVRRLARATGAQSLLDHGLTVISRHLTTSDEVLRVA